MAFLTQLWLQIPIMQYYKFGNVFGNWIIFLIAITHLWMSVRGVKSTRKTFMRRLWRMASVRGWSRLFKRAVPSVTYLKIWLTCMSCCIQLERWLLFAYNFYYVSFIWYINNKNNKLYSCALVDCQWLRAGSFTGSQLGSEWGITFRHFIVRESMMTKQYKEI